ncbi:hypothetical protein T492DRAFT_857723 [Pavlovales sp. CCMP2436]|nr:hypothetical protein T492DRAFT_857723 [Pavlovales sp. CCMP2436]
MTHFECPKWDEHCHASMRGPQEKFWLKARWKLAVEQGRSKAGPSSILDFYVPSGTAEAAPAAEAVVQWCAPAEAADLVGVGVDVKLCILAESDSADAARLLEAELRVRLALVGLSAELGHVFHRTWQQRGAETLGPAARGEARREDPSGKRRAR